MSSINDLDKNFAPLESNDTFDWYDAAQMPLGGLGWPDESAPFCRFPDRSQGVVRDAMWELSRHSAGVCVDFTTDAKNLSARWNLHNETLGMSHMPATGVSGVDLYALRDGKWRWFAVGVPSVQDTEAVLAKELDGTMRQYRLYFPLYNGVHSLHVGVSHGAAFFPGSAALGSAAPAASAPDSAKKPICFYGTSIVHGGCASRTGMAYPAILSRRLGYPAFNLGFSGNAQCEPAVADLLAELDPSAYVLDPLPNMSADMIRENLGPLIRKLRAAHSTTPIVLVECVILQNAVWADHAEVFASVRNEIARSIFEELCATDANLHLVKCDDLLGDDGEATVDGIHPTDVGFLRMADAIGAVLGAVL